MAARQQLLALRTHPNLQRFLIANARPTGRMLGKGSYGSVEELEVNGVVCAGKKIHESLIERENLGAENIASKYVEECQLMSDLRHPHLVQFLGVCFLPSSSLPVLVMERLLTSLDELLEHNPDIPLSLKRSILADVARGLVYLHSHSPQVIHRDLSAKNVLLNSAMVAKISDLGNARIVNLQPGELARTLTRMPGTMVYMSPEVFEDTSKYGPSLDSFSFGHLSLFTITQVFPRTLLQPTYRDPANPKARLARTEVQRRDEYIKLLYQQLGEQHPLVLLVEECLDNEPSERPSAQDLLQRLEGMKAHIKDPYQHLTKLDAMRMLREKDMENQDLLTQASGTSRQELAIEAMQGQMEQLQLETSSQLAAKDSQLTAMNSQLTAKDVEIARLGEEMERFQLEYSSQLATKDAENSSLSEEMGRFQLEYSSQLTTKDSQLTAKDAQLISKDVEISRLGQEMGRFQLAYSSQLNAKNSQLAAKDAQLIAKDDEISRLGEDLRRLQADLEAREAHIQEMVAQTERKEAQIQGQEPIYDDQEPIYDDQEPIYDDSAPLYEVPVASGWGGLPSKPEDEKEKRTVDYSSFMASATASSATHTEPDGAGRGDLVEEIYNDFYSLTDQTTKNDDTAAEPEEIYEEIVVTWPEEPDIYTGLPETPTDREPGDEDDKYEDVNRIKLPDTRLQRAVQTCQEEGVYQYTIPETPDLPSKLYDVSEKPTGGASSSRASASAFGASLTRPGGDGSVDGEHIYEKLPSLSSNAQLPSSEPTEDTTAEDQPKQDENVPAWAPGTEVTGKYYFPGPDPSDLPFNYGDTLTIIRRSKYSNWYMARRHDGREGLIPGSFVQEKHTATHTGPKRPVPLRRMLWFHGEVSRKNVEKLLKPYRNGKFLVREANKYKGDYALCVSFKNKVNYYRIRRNDKNWVTVDDEQYFANLVKLVEHFQKDEGGLCCQLQYPVEKESGSFECTLSLQDFTDRGWAIPRNSLKKNSLVRKGDIKEVWLGEYQGQKVAVTIIKDTKDEKITQKSLAEAAIMTTMQHPNLVHLIGVCLDNLSVCFITEYMAMGSLRDYLMSRGRADISQSDQLDFARDICRGMVYLESKNLVHRKLAARNVLLGEDNTAKVSDFRLTREESFKTDRREKLLVKWTAPEAIRENKFSNKSDVWSFGILLWEIYSYGRTPYPKLGVTEVLPHVEQGNRMGAPDSCTDGIYQIMKECWDKEASQRPNFVRIEKMLQFESICMA